MNARPLSGLDRFSINQITLDHLPFSDAVAGCERFGIPWIAPWRHKVDEVGVDKAARMLRDAGLKVSSLLRGGFFPATERERAARRDDNQRAVDAAAELGTDVLVLVCGGVPNRDLQLGREMVREGIATLAPYAKAARVRLAIEPLHPMFTADRSVVVTLGQAVDLASDYDPDNVGVIVDVYHVWWDPRLYEEIERARGRILGYHVSDWTIPTPELLAGRGLMGEGVIDLRRIRGAVESTGYAGPIEVEILNRSLWTKPMDEVLSAVTQSYLDFV